MSPTRMGTKANFSPSLSLPSSIYDCALDPSRWEQTLADVTHTLDCHYSALHLTDLRRHQLFSIRLLALIRTRSSKHLARAVGELWRTIGDAFSPYRPELHYMRGPGPKCRVKHQAS